MDNKITNEHAHLHTIFGVNGDAHIISSPLHELNILIEFMREVLYSKYLPYNRHAKTGEYRSVRNLLSLSIRSLPAWKNMYDGDLEYSPDLALFFDCLRKHPIRETTPGGNFNQWAETANDFVIHVRQEAKHNNSKRKIKDWRRNPHENKKRLDEYLDYLFERYARLMIIHLDFIYRKSTCSDSSQARVMTEEMRKRQYRQRREFFDGEETNVIGGNVYSVSIEEAKEDWRRFFDNTRGKPSLFEHLVGHVVRFEYGSVGGYHIHAALFFDGSKIRQDQFLAQCIGDYWIKTTNGRGIFFNCNRKKYKRPGLGIVDYHDETKRDDLRSALHYLAKSEQFVRVKTSSRAKLFLTGKIDRNRVKELGRPRKKSSRENSLA